jgi:hypothetical protein
MSDKFKPSIAILKSATPRKVADVSQIQESSVNLENKTDLLKFVEEPCLKACEYLCDCNIKTIMNGANSYNCDEAYIIIDWRSLDNVNKIMADKMTARGKAKDFSPGGLQGERWIKIGFPISNDMYVRDVSEKLLQMAKAFVPQDILFDRFKPWEIVNIVAAKVGDKSYAERVCKGKSIDEIARDFGWILDKNSGDIFENAEALRRHQQYAVNVNLIKRTTAKQVNTL